MIEPNIPKAVELLRAGGLVAFPTETVYGLGADATNALAVRRIFHAKERPFDHPLIVHLAHLEQLDQWAVDISADALKLAKKFWPGPLTMILKKHPQVLDVVTGGQNTVGLRIPRHPTARHLLEAFGGGIAAPSANRFTHISPTTAAAVDEELQGKIDLILDGGACEVGLESTIVDMSGDEPAILRPGMISREAIAAELGLPVITREKASEIRAPGMHHLHYAPTTKTMWVATNALASKLQALTLQNLPLACVVHSKTHSPSANQIHWVKMPQDPAAYAHDLYHVLRLLDKQQFNYIVIEMVPSGSEWDAIRDRLLKASAS